MPLTTCSGHQSKAPLRADQLSTSKDGNKAHSRSAPKSANVPCTQPKPHPLPRSKHSDPLTSSAEEDIFFSNFARCSFIRNKSNNASEEPKNQLPDSNFTNSYHLLTTADDFADDMDNDTQQVEASLEDDSAVPRNESDTGTGISPAATNKRETTATQSNGEHGSNIAMNNRVNVAVSSSNEPNGHAAVNERRINASPFNTDSVIQTNERENAAAHHPCRSSAQKSYLPSDKGKFVESSGSDSDWAATEERAKQWAEAEADNNDDDSEGCNKEDKLEDGDKMMHKVGRLSKEAILAVHDFGKRVQEEATDIGKRFGKHWQVILMEAGLARKATCKESIWNQHQAWFKTVLHLSKAASLQAWKAKQAEHYHTYSHKDPKNAALWKQIQEHFDHAIATPDDLSSQESCSLMMAVHEMFAKSHMIDEITTILKYKDLEAAQAGGKNINFLPPAAPVANASLLRNSKSDRDRNCMVAPMVITEAFTEAGHVLKTSNSRWMTMLDVLYSTRLCIYDWPTGVPPPGTDFDLKALSTSQLHALVGPYLRIHLGEMYEAELGQDEDEDDSDAEKGKMAK
ncbi:uncharacterized protein BJ212DRAFT_1482864 [Suillus subaureus]|uniref:Uncharacterized protein n=1 Tax=Suillus subaureus TaxID=48587 RepID=A0A9P7E6I8_9AGAM|nr:uncharacterized protein BJ212DRAFT_1482864 [Suillus subaureus]KAG1812795.1 hypothetical protein BJ212DRAFT_1482864 [Suillus subaureus]